MLKISYNKGKLNLKRKGNIEENYIVLNILLKETIKEATLLKKYNKTDIENLIKDLMTQDFNEKNVNINYIVN